MAIYHFSVKSGRSGCAFKRARYLTRKVKKMHHDQEKVIEFCQHFNFPEWAKDPLNFWFAADLYERKNASAYREFEVALLEEESPSERKETLVSFLTQEGLLQEYVVTVVIHSTLFEGKLIKPFGFVMVCERRLDGIDRDAKTFFSRAAASRTKKDGSKKSVNPAQGGCRKVSIYSGGDRGGDRIKAIRAVRLRWENHLNRRLEMLGSPNRVYAKCNNDQTGKMARNGYVGRKEWFSKKAIKIELEFLLRQFNNAERAASEVLFRRKSQKNNMPFANISEMILHYEDKNINDFHKINMGGDNKKLSKSNLFELKKYSKCQLDKLIHIEQSIFFVEFKEETELAKINANVVAEFNAWSKGKGLDIAYQVNQWEHDIWAVNLYRSKKNLSSFLDGRQNRDEIVGVDAVRLAELEGEVQRWEELIKIRNHVINELPYQLLEKARQSHLLEEEKKRVKLNQVRDEIARLRDRIIRVDGEEENHLTEGFFDSMGSETTVGCRDGVSLYPTHNLPKSDQELQEE